VRLKSRLSRLHIAAFSLSAKHRLGGSFWYGTGRIEVDSGTARLAATCTKCLTKPSPTQFASDLALSASTRADSAFLSSSCTVLAKASQRALWLRLDR
jgi:hypothetical protein